MALVTDMLLNIAASHIAPRFSVIGLSHHVVRDGSPMSQNSLCSLYISVAYTTFQRYAHASYAEVIPPGKETVTVYGQCSITDKVRLFCPSKGTSKAD